MHQIFSKLLTKRRLKQAGLTLVETAVSTGIIGLVGAMSLQMLGRYQRSASEIRNRSAAQVILRSVFDQGMTRGWSRADFAFGIIAPTVINTNDPEIVARTYINEDGTLITVPAQSPNAASPVTSGPLSGYDTCDRTAANTGLGKPWRQWDVLRVRDWDGSGVEPFAYLNVDGDAEYLTDNNAMKIPARIYRKVQRIPRPNNSSSAWNGQMWITVRIEWRAGDGSSNARMQYLEMHGLRSAD